MGSTGRRGGKQDLVNLQCQTREFPFDPFIHGEVPLEQWRRDILERLDYGSGRRIRIRGAGNSAGGDTSQELPEEGAAELV